MESTTSNAASEFDFKPEDIIQEWLWDDDVDADLRERISALTGTDLVDEDYDGVVDGVVLWWRDGDDEDELADTIVDAEATRGEDAPFWIVTPKPGREGAASSFTIQNAAKNAGMNVASPVTVSDNWNGVRLVSFGNGKGRPER
ncbi:MAG: DUF3052 domain-containing protein [Bifidobacteriaceae bacterium]|nr:DUF3052 domain-containing protein [Bifidobacteriaceae bacterium]MCI1978653.1 DUF3052 domain-containing protein [Bifidobacteriaceae bacterium]